MNPNKNNQKLYFGVSVAIFSLTALILFSINSSAVLASDSSSGDTVSISVKPDEPPGQAKKDQTSAPTNNNSTEAPAGETADSNDNSDSTSASTDDTEPTTEIEDETPTENNGKDSAPGQIKKAGVTKEESQEKLKKLNAFSDIDSKPVVGIAEASNPVPCRPGNLIKSTDKDTIYYCARDGKRYLFPHRNIFSSWYKDFSSIMTISSDVLLSIPLGGTVTYRPGVRMIKTTNDNKTYVVTKGRVLRWIENEDVAAQLYGEDWNQQIDDVDESILSEYTIGPPVTDADVM